MYETVEPGVLDFPVMPRWEPRFPVASVPARFLWTQVIRSLYYAALISGLLSRKAAGVVASKR